MWRHMESTCPITDRKGALSMEALLAATAGPDGQGCSLTRLTEAWPRGDIVPDPRNRNGTGDEGPNGVTVFEN